MIVGLELIENVSYYIDFLIDIENSKFLYCLYYVNLLTKIKNIKNDYNFLFKIKLIYFCKQIS